MSMRPPSRGGTDRSSAASVGSTGGRGGGNDKNNTSGNLDDPLQLVTENDNLSDDDNAQIDTDETKDDNEDPLLLAIDDLEGRVVGAIDDVKLHPGIKTGTSSVHDELASLLRPVLEVAAHTGPSVARTYYRGSGPEGIEASVEDVYERTVSDLALPVMLEIAQSDTNPAKRGASLEFFRTYYKECHKAGSWLDTSTIAIQAGPYGPGGSHHLTSGTTPAMRIIIKRRQQKRLIREGEILRYWVEAAVACLVTGVFTDADAEGAVASRGIIAASAALRPSLQHIAQRIRDADDRGATRLYSPVMKMVDGVLRKLFLPGSNDSVRSACIKFLEIVMLCCSHKPPDDSSRRKGQGTPEGFALDDLPIGHPVITREALESVADYTFTTLRGLTLMGGQVKIDSNMMQDMMMRVDGSAPSNHIVAILKPAALAFLEIESVVPKQDSDGNSPALDFIIDRVLVDYDFYLSQKSYALTINALSAIAMNRPTFFYEAAVTLAQRAKNPPAHQPGGDITKPAAIVIASQLRASCLTLLRNALSITTNASVILHKVLVILDMELQADKALQMASQANELKTASRSARNQAKMFYEWDASEVDRRTTKRQKETDDALAKMRAAKRQRGLGAGVQLPSSMTDSIELILLNLDNLPTKHPSTTPSTVLTDKTNVSLDFVIDAIMTNGASLLRDEGRWYDRSGGGAWTIDFTSKENFSVGPALLDALETINSDIDKNVPTNETVVKRNELFVEQSRTAASDAIRRILSSTANCRSKSLASLGNQLAARLAFALKGVTPLGLYKESYAMAKESAASFSSVIAEQKTKYLGDFVEEYPLVASTVASIATANVDLGVDSNTHVSTSEIILNEALMQTTRTDEAVDTYWRKYDMTLNLIIASTVHASQLTKDKPNDADRKKAAAQSAVRLQKDLAGVPRLTPDSLNLLCAMCDIDDITKKSAEAFRKSSNELIAVSAASHAAKVAAEKRATAVLSTLRDIVLQRDIPSIRKSAVDCVVGIASGRLPTSPSIHDKATKLTMNVLFPKNDLIADLVVNAVLSDLELAATWAIENYDDIQKANADSQKKDTAVSNNPKAARSEMEKLAIDKMKRPSVLIMALCVRRIELVQKLFELSCQDKALILAKAVRLNMSKLATAIAAKYGVAGAALQVANMTATSASSKTTSDTTSMLFAFIDSLIASLDKGIISQEIIDSCLQIQELKLLEDGKRDPRYLIPIVSGMKRNDLIVRLPEFVVDDESLLLAALVRMGDRLNRHALHFRDEPDIENPSLHGMTLCEQLVYLHRLDFAAAGLPQKRYLSAIKLCLDDDKIFTDQVLMSALDVMSGQFLTGAHKLPLAFMRTNILVCTKHESLHSWMCNLLLPRLVEGTIWNDPRQWEGWMRCAHMLEKNNDPTVSSRVAIEQLPPEQLLQYRSKWAK